MEHLYFMKLTTHDKEQLLAIARRSIRQGLYTLEPLEVDLTSLSDALLERAGSFVTLSQEGRLRGCIGTVDAKHPLAQSVASAAYGSAYEDIRFAPLSDSEVNAVRIEISVLSKLDKIDARSQDELISKLRPFEDGLVIKDEEHIATFLPKVWRQIDDPLTFVLHLKAKANIGAEYWSKSIECYRFTANLFSDDGALCRIEKTEKADEQSVRDG